MMRKGMRKKRAKHPVVDRNLKPKGKGKWHGTPRVSGTTGVAQTPEGVIIDDFLWPSRFDS